MKVFYNNKTIERKRPDQEKRKDVYICNSKKRGRLQTTKGKDKEIFLQEKNKKCGKFL